MLQLSPQGRNYFLVGSNASLSKISTVFLHTVPVLPFSEANLQAQKETKAGLITTSVRLAVTESQVLTLHSSGIQSKNR